MSSAYDLLGVKKTSSADEIRNAYKEKAMMNHPDRGGDPTIWGGLQKAYDTLSDPQRRAAYDKSRDISGSAEKQYAEGFASQDGERKSKMSISQQVGDFKGEGKLDKIGAQQMTHAAGFEAWMRNQKGLGKTSFYTAEDLLRSKRGGIEATDATSTFLPPLSTTAVCYDKHGPPEDVLYVDKARALPEKLAHGEVLVHMLAACVNDEDLLRVQTSLSVLNDFAPFNRTANKWEEEELPAVVGVEGVGVVLATAQNVPGQKDYALEVKDWVIATPDARKAPIGCFATLCVCDSSRLIKVPAQLLPLQHLACSRSLCSAYRLLEDYGSVKPGDTVIQNAADLPVGQAVIQLCKMLKIRTINLVPDDASFARTKELLMSLGATMVLKDNSAPPRPHALPHAPTHPPARAFSAVRAPLLLLCRRRRLWYSHARSRRRHTRLTVTRRATFLVWQATWSPSSRSLAPRCRASPWTRSAARRASASPSRCARAARSWCTRSRRGRCRSSRRR
jgi:trans-2-enoyl-CoA reductase